MEENILVSAKNLMSFLDKNRRSILELLMLEYNLSENDFDRLNILSDIKDFILSITGFSQNQPTSRYLDREECRGEYFLGNVVWMNRNIGNFYLRDIELSENMLVVGRTGTGKTTTVRRILYEWILKRKPALIFDWKGDYISLYNLFRDEEDFLKYFWVVDPGRGNFKFNPLRIPLNNDRLIVKPITWIEAFIDIFIHSFGLREASSSILMVALKNVYKKFNIDLYDRRFNETIFPRLIDLLEMVERYEPLSGFDRESQRSIIIRLRLLTQGLLGEMFNTYIGVRLEDIVKRFVIMNLKNIPLAVNKKFIIECMYGLIYEYVKAINDRSKTKFLFVIEEAHNVLSKHKPDLEKDILSKPEICLAELRDFGYGTIIVDQKPSELSPDAIANTSIKICHALDRNEDKETMVSAMSLKDYWLNELNKLDKGYALVKINREGVKECFMLKINPIFPSSTNFEEIFSYKYLDDRSLNFREKNVLKEYSELELNIIRLIGCSKACIYRHIKEFLSIDGLMLKEILLKMVKNGLIGYRYVRAKGMPTIFFLRNRGVEIFEIMEKMSPSMARIYMQEKKYGHKELLQKVLKYFMSKGYKVMKSDTRADLLVNIKGINIPVEIETGLNNNFQIFRNIFKNLGKYLTILFVVPNNITQNAVLQQAAKIRFKYFGKSFTIMIYRSGKIYNYMFT